MTVQSKPSDFYVYIHRKETDGSIFYVGKGRKKRAWQTYSRNAEWARINSEHGAKVEVVRSGMSEVCALTLERIGISKIGLENLCNQRAGGYGSNCGWSPSEEARRKIGDFHRGKKKTPEAIAKTRAAHLGVKRSPETCAKNSLAAKNRIRVPHSAETRAKIAASHIGLKPSPDALAKMKAAPRPRGKDSPSYDHTIRSMVHSDGRVFVGTRGEFKTAHGAQDSCLSELIKGTRFSVKGWRINNV